MKWFKMPRPKQVDPWQRRSQRKTVKGVPDLIQKNRMRLGKLLLLIGLGLAVLVILEMRQEMVKAWVPDAQPSPPIERAVPPIAITVPQIKPTQPQTTRKQTVAQASRSVIARNTDSDTSAAGQVSQVSPTQLAANVWSGSSFPVENFEDYTSPFGYRVSATGASSSEFHYGLDMAAPQGSYIRSWWTGKAVEVTDNTNCGTSIVVESGHWLHIYCHMMGQVETGSDGKPYLIDRSGGIQIGEGQEVPAGARIGRVGMTGRTTGPHLHWGLKYDGNWVNPALVLRAMYAGQQAATRSTGAGQ